MDNNVIFKIGYGLYVMSVNDGDKDNGCIINTVMQVTDVPLRLATVVNKKSYTREIALKTKKFNISIVSQSAPFSLFKTFGFQSGRNINKFKDIIVNRSSNNITYLQNNISAYISCEIVKEIDLGTHNMFICDLVDGEVISDEEPVTYSYYQKYIKQKAKATVKKGWRCEVCGYVYEGEELPKDFICPICKHGVVDFVEID